MSAERRRRLERLLDIRKTELDKRVGELGAAQERERLSLGAYKSAREKTLLALAERDERAKRGTSIELWMEAEQWLARVKELETAMRQKMDFASKAVVEARMRVAGARREQAKIEHLLARIRKREQDEENRADQKANDEAAAATFLRRREERA